MYTICRHFLLNFFKRTARVLVAFNALAALHLKLLTLHSQIKSLIPLLDSCTTIHETDPYFQ